MHEPVDLLPEYLRLERKRSREALTPRELRRWTLLKRALGRYLHPNLPHRHADRRQSVRVPIRLAVCFRSEGELVSSYMTNLSRGGLFVATDTPCDIGTRIHLSIEIEESGEKLDLSGQVVSTGMGADLQTGRSGMGVKFLDVSPAARKRLDDLHERALRRLVGS